MAAARLPSSGEAYACRSHPPTHCHPDVFTAVVSWTAPTDLGGGTLTGYTPGAGGGTCLPAGFGGYGSHVIVLHPGTAGAAGFALHMARNPDTTHGTDVPQRGRRGSSRERWRCIKIQPRRCLGGRGRDCRRCGKPLITARRAAVLHDIGLMPIKSLDHPELGILRAHEPVGLGFAGHPCAVSRASQVTELSVLPARVLMR